MVVEFPIECVSKSPGQANDLERAYVHTQGNSSQPAFTLMIKWKRLQYNHTHTPTRHSQSRALDGAGIADDEYIQIMKVKECFWWL